MEPEIIDWSNVESTFEEDSTYEFINAPKWVDLSAPPEPVDDAWFCKPNCKHHKTPEEFPKSTRNFKMKFLRSMSISEILPFRERRDVKQKAKEINVSSAEIPSIETEATKSSCMFNEDSENLNPNLTTPPLNKTEKKKQREDSHANSSRQEKKPGLKSTFSARNLVAGREVLSQITEFCAELKKLARNSLKKGSSEKVSRRVSGELKKERVREKERKPLLLVKQTGA